MESTNVRLLEAEVHRTRGELLLLHQPGVMNDAAAACFRHAIDLARQQGARWWELRATVSLCRLLGAQATTPEERAHARQMLADIYGWFREGLGTRDLQEARELLIEIELKWQ
jgi:predicted ATPase